MRRYSILARKEIEVDDDEVDAARRLGIRVDRIEYDHRPDEAEELAAFVEKLARSVNSTLAMQREITRLQTLVDRQRDQLAARPAAALGFKFDLRTNRDGGISSPLLAVPNVAGLPAFELTFAVDRSGRIKSPVTARPITE
jgi:hypothetical protein